jgi:hypothetical protein
MKALRIISTSKHYHNWRYLFLRELLTRLHHSLLAVEFAAVPEHYLYNLYYTTKVGAKLVLKVGLNS